ncbi:hypothetical protein JCM10213v2_004804 [Rhodosporidiobolus nylandii]
MYAASSDAPPAPAPSASRASSSLNPRAASFRLEASDTGGSNSSTGSGSGGSSVERSAGEDERGRRGLHAAVVQSGAASVGVPSSTPALHPHDHNRQHDSSPSTASLLTLPPAGTSHASPTVPLELRRRTTSSPTIPSPASDDSASLSSLSSRWSLLPLRTFQRLHLLVFALSFVLLFLLPVTLLVAYRREVRWAPFALGVASWLAGETLREVIFELLTFEGGVALGADGEEERGHVAKKLALPTVVHAVAQEFLRLGAVALAVALLPTPSSPFPSASSVYLPTQKEANQPAPRPPLPPLDTLFFSALWLALGWAAVEILWGSRRLWKQLELYEDVLPAPGQGFVELSGDEEERALFGVEHRDYALGEPAVAHEGEAGSVVDYGTPAPPDPEEWEADEEDYLARLREVQRDELEAQLGVPLFEIPVGVVMIWRLDSILLSLVLTLLLSLPFRLTPPSLFAFPLWPTFASAAFLHALLSWIWLARVRAWGVPAISYASLVLLVLLCFAVSGAWGVLE